MTIIDNTRIVISFILNSGSDIGDAVYIHKRKKGPRKKRGWVLYYFLCEEYVFERLSTAIAHVINSGNRIVLTHISIPEYFCMEISLDKLVLAVDDYESRYLPKKK